MKLKESKFSAQRIYLIGYMASGKSTVGQLLAEGLEYDFVDTDTAIEKLSGLSVERIFETEGEQWFRDKETEILKFTTELERTVISTGGGLPFYNNNLPALLSSGLTIYLELTTETLANRIMKDSQTRPLHNENDKDSILSSVKKKLSVRQHCYQEAHITFNGNQRPEELVKTIISKIRGEH